MVEIQSKLKERFNNCNDFFIRKIDDNYSIYYLARLCDKNFISENIIKPIIMSKQVNEQNIFSVVSLGFS